MRQYEPRPGMSTTGFRLAAPAVPKTSFRFCWTRSPRLSPPAPFGFLTGARVYVRCTFGRFAGAVGGRSTSPARWHRVFIRLTALCYSAVALLHLLSKRPPGDMGWSRSLPLLSGLHSGLLVHSRSCSLWWLRASGRGGVRSGSSRAVRLLLHSALSFSYGLLVRAVADDLPCSVMLGSLQRTAKSSSASFVAFLFLCCSGLSIFPPLFLAPVGLLSCCPFSFLALLFSGKQSCLVVFATCNCCVCLGLWPASPSSRSHTTRRGFACAFDPSSIRSLALVRLPLEPLPVHSRLILCLSCIPPRSPFPPNAHFTKLDAKLRALHPFAFF